ncbi:late competence protein ComGC [Geomicrobium sp. JCM 19037]|uniref:competence type IV pilus major pilin ComGC n=1 Tax=unclassified Geomicrobium TaxID=2628951 RepID=UPI00045F4877|nr:competence type IV pilus major pilin ComGC [Geomicrobium sp. JCM 19037]GAK03368.1 late competence protein ComGC [Geomicrobium sp. JCM 19037]
MKQFWKKQGGFTLIEMMIVLLIISVLLLIAIPNMVKNSEVAQSKSCEATIDLLRAQAGSYEVQFGKPLTDLKDLQSEGLVDRITCPNGDTISLKDLEIGSN